MWVKKSILFYTIGTWVGGGVFVCWSVSAIDQKKKAKSFEQGTDKKKQRKKDGAKQTSCHTHREHRSFLVPSPSVRLYVHFYALFSLVGGNGILIVFIRLLIGNK